MSETLSQDPESLGSAGYTTLTSYPPTPATPSSTVQDAPGGINLPPFSTFSAEMDVNGSGFVSDRIFSDARLLDVSNWDYYTETRLLERGENGLSIIASQPQYRPWESKPIDSTSQDSLRQTFATAPVNTFAEAFAQNGVPKLPSFQSQFQSFNEPVTTSEPTLTTLTNLTPVSPNSSPGSHNLTTLNSNFHTLSAVNPRNYPLVPAPIQAREIPSIQQQFLDERHIQLYTHPTTNLTTLSNTIHPTGIFTHQNGAIIQNSQLISSPTVVTVLKTDPDIKLTGNITLQEANLKVQNVGLHPTQFQNPMSTIIDNTMYNGLDKKINGMNANMNSPTRNDFRKKERRKMRASSLESSAESDGASSNMEIGSENSGQVAAVSSTASFKSHHSLTSNSVDIDEISGGNVDKQVKKKRKRCGECIGCQRKDNCGDCAPCRNDKSHQICKQRRCEKLTEKKNLYGEAGFLRGESRRGRGKGRGAGSYRGRKPSGPVTSLSAGSTTVPVAPEPNTGGLPPPSRPSPQPAVSAPVHMLKQEQPAQQQPMAPMPFYADPNRFTTPVWQADGAQAWPQGQFIQQIPAAAQPTLEGYTQQYPNGIYQTTYQQAPFDGSTFYAGAVQVLTNARPPSAPSHAQLTPRTNGTYSHTPSPVPTQQQNTQQGAAPQRQYQQEYVATTPNYIAPATTPTPSVDNSRPNSVNSTVNTSTNNQSFPQQEGVIYTSVSSTNYSPSSNSAPSYVISNVNVNANSGNAKPGYPQVNSNPQLVSLSSSGCPGSNYSGNESQLQQQQPPPHPPPQQSWDSIMLQNDNHPTWGNPEKSENSGQSYGSQLDQGYQNRNEDSKEILDISQNQQSEPHFSQADRVNLNTRLKTMILNKQQNLANKLEEGQKLEENQTGHFLSYSHHHRLGHLGDDGGKFLVNQSTYVPQNIRQEKLHKKYTPNGINKSLTASPMLTACKKEKDTTLSSNFINKHQEHSFNSSQDSGYYSSPERNNTSRISKALDDDENHKTNVGLEIPPCSCFPEGCLPPEPGSYYTHLGSSSSLTNLRKDFETRTGLLGNALRIEKVCYTGKEGKTSQGCPLAKWIIRRSGYEEKFLIIVKHRKGHICPSTFIVVCIVAWDGITNSNADELYSMLTEKLNKFGLPTTRRCATNEPRTCACQGLDPDKCGASFSFGCSWSMYYNGCKFARSKIVRKFRLTEKSEEQLVEEKMQSLANHLSPLYRTLAPISFENQCRHENTAFDCRLGYNPGRPFSGVTACMDFCAHAHKDSQNMIDGCTVVVTLTKNRTLTKANDEQLHVLPLYVVDETDEFGSREHQAEKLRNGAIEALNKFHCEVRVRRTPLQPCRRTGKKRKDSDDTQDTTRKPNIVNNSPIKQSYTPTLPYNQRSNHFTEQMPKAQIKSEDQLQSNQVSSTVLDSPNGSPFYRYDNNYNFVCKQPLAPVQGRNWWGYDGVNSIHNVNVNPVVFRRTVLESEPNTALNMYPNQNVQRFSSGNPYNFPGCSTPAQSGNYYVNPLCNTEVNSNFSNNYFGVPQQISQNSIKLPSFNQNFAGKHQRFISEGYEKFSALSNYYDNFYSDQKPYYNSFDVTSNLPNFYETNLNTHHSASEFKKPNLLGDVRDYTDNLECFRDSQVGGVAIALGHGSVLFECAKHELHATTALKKPDRTSPTRISLVFYQHRNLNRSKHGLDEYEDKMRLRKMGVNGGPNTGVTFLGSDLNLYLNPDMIKQDIMLRAPTFPTVSLTTLFPMYPCTVTGPYQEKGDA